MESESKKKGKKKYYIIVAVMYAMILFIAWSINVFQNKVHSFTFINIYPWYLQLVAGLAAGLVIGVLGAMMTLTDKYFTTVKNMVLGLFDNFSFTIVDIVILCLLAGVIEEILFRGVLQPMIGIWISSFLFIFIHGYFNLSDKNLTVFGMLMFFLSVGIGYMYEYSGMITAMSFHFAFDLAVLLMYFRYVKKEKRVGEENAS